MNNQAPFWKRNSSLLPMTLFWIYILTLHGVQSFNSSNFTDIITNLTIGCDDVLYGSIERGQIVFIDFVNEDVQDVTFTDCNSSFDTTLYLRNSEGTFINSQSTNNCYGDDCYDEEYCPGAWLRETFTMRGLDEGTYTIQLASYANHYNGSWTLEVFCTETEPTPYPTTSPTYYSNSTHEVIYTTTTYDFAYNTINCTVPHCTIICQHSYGCRSSYLGTSNAESVEIQCTVNWACRWLNVALVNVSQVTIYCGATYACWYMDVTINETASFSMECVRYGCRNSDIMIVANEAEFIGSGQDAFMASTIYGQGIGSRLTVKCTEPYSCKDTYVFCPINGNALCHIRCDDDHSCPPLSPLYAYFEEVKMLNINMSDTEENAIWQCDVSTNQSECIAVFANSQYLVCEEGTFCDFDCAGNSTCEFDILDGSPAVAMTVTCDGEHSCLNTEIICPSVFQNASCLIICDDSESCRRASIIVADPEALIRDIQIECVGYRSCFELTVSIDANTINNISAFCDGFNACSNAKWIATSEHLENVLLVCNDMFACNNTHFDFADAQNSTAFFQLEHNSTNYYRVYGVDFYCPYRTKNSCNFYILGFNRSQPFSVNIIVPEEYEYGYLNVKFEGEETLGNGTVHVQCDPDHKDTVDVTLWYNQNTSKLQCNDTGATFCCPFGERIEYNSDDHESTESDFDYDLIDLNRWRSLHEDYTYFLFANGTAEHVDRVIACDDMNCVVECDEKLSCALSIIKLNYSATPTTTDSDTVGNTEFLDVTGIPDPMEFSESWKKNISQNSDVSDVVISCSASFSCLSVVISKEISYELHQKLFVSVICSGTDSCNQLTVNLVEFDSFNLYCVDSGSCQEVTVNLDVGISDDIDIPTDYGIIHCVLPSVCDDLRFNTNSERSQLMMYEFSRGIVLNNGIGYLSAIDNIECNQNRWIQFDGNLETDYTMIQSINNEYDNGYLPCDDVEVQCGNESCIMSYEYIGSDVVSTLNDGSDTAYSVNINDLYLITCNGECEQSPTESPTDAPTNAPSHSPSDSPSMTPSNSPSGFPSAAPSHSPTNSPTLSPTQYPKQTDTFDSYTEWHYALSRVQEEEMHYISRNILSFTDNLTSFIEYGFDAESATIEYRFISVNITKINEVKIDNLVEMDTDPRSEIFEIGTNLTVLSYTNCSESECLYLIGDRFDESVFESNVIDKLRSYFDKMVFGVDAQSGTSIVSLSVIMHSEEALSLHPEAVIDPVEYINYILMGITALFSIIGFVAFLYQKGVIPKIPRKVDTSRWTAWIGLGIQFWDFASDISLCFELWSVPLLFEEENRLVLVCAIGSTAFLIIPYISNLWSATKIKQIVRGNDEATTWFKNHSKVFTLFVVLTGGSHPALALVSSQVFGLDIFSSGLTKHEMRGLLKLKIYYSVLLENIPQLIFQGLYASTLTEGLTNTVLFAMTGSLLSVLATMLSYAIDRREDEGDVFAVDYYLALERKENDQEMIALSDDEKIRIKQNRGWRLKLSRSLTAIWQIPDKTIEIGNTLISSNGCITHIVHFMAKDAVELYASELFGDEMGVDVAPMDIIRQFYSNRREEILMILKSHFDLRGDFNVFCQNRSERKRRTMSVGSNSSYGSGMGSYSPSAESKTAVFRTALNVFLFDDNDGEKMEKLMKCMDDINRTETVRTEDVGDDGGHMITERSGTVLEMSTVNQSKILSVKRHSDTSQLEDIEDIVMDALERMNEEATDYDHEVRESYF